MARHHRGLWRRWYLSGSASCNNYMATYTVDGDGITIGPAASTRMMCADPEGVMEQEMAYLASLTTAGPTRSRAISSNCAPPTARSWPRTNRRPLPN